MAYKYCFEQDFSLSNPLLRGRWTEKLLQQIETSTALFRREFPYEFSFYMNRLHDSRFTVKSSARKMVETQWNHMRKFKGSIESSV